MKKLLMILSLALCSKGLAAGVFIVTSPGPLSGTSIVINIQNQDTYAIESISFDLTGTSSSGGPLVIDPPTFGEANSTGGTATFTNPDVSTFGYTFDSFDFGDSFSFSWDPDVAGNSSFGAIVGDQAGMGITIGTSAGFVSGTLAVVTDVTGAQYLEARIDSPTSRVPDSGTTVVLFGSAMMGVAGLRRVLRRK